MKVLNVKSTMHNLESNLLLPAICILLTSGIMSGISGGGGGKSGSGSAIVF